ncbi:hypothetical protein M1534_00715 [Patescibacteria group bacterium]|nr:hypothetical protein [Patescibacteria group bacterium]
MLSALIAGIGSVLTAFISAFSYGGIFVLMFLESANIPIPSEVIMPFGGFLAANNKMIFWLVVAAGTLGNIGGSAFSYWLGLRGEERWGKYFGITARDVGTFQKHQHKYAAIAKGGNECGQHTSYTGDQGTEHNKLLRCAKCCGSIIRINGININIGLQLKTRPNGSFRQY